MGAGAVDPSPAILDKAVQAADAEDAAGDEYLDAVAKETLRIRPVVFDVGRVLKEPVELAGYQLPAGVMVVPAIGLVHSDSEVYPMRNGSTRTGWWVRR